MTVITRVLHYNHIYMIIFSSGTILTDQRSTDTLGYILTWSVQQITHDQHNFHKNGLTLCSLSFSNRLPSRGFLTKNVPIWWRQHDFGYH